MNPCAFPLAASIDFVSGGEDFSLTPGMRSLGMLSIAEYSMEEYICTSGPRKDPLSILIKMVNAQETETASCT